MMTDENKVYMIEQATVEKVTRKPCVRCHWMEKIGRYPYCVSPLASRDPVFDDPLTCSDQRSSEGDCGPEGKLWTEKPEPVKRNVFSKILDYLGII